MGIKEMVRLSTAGRRKRSWLVKRVTGPRQGTPAVFETACLQLPHALLAYADPLADRFKRMSDSILKPIPQSKNVTLARFKTVKRARDLLMRFGGRCAGIG